MAAAVDMAASTTVEHVEPAVCSIKVVCRIRPLNDSEERSKSQFIFSSIGEDSLTCGGKTFVYDKVFHPKTPQEKVYTETARQIVKGQHLSV